MGLFLSEKQYVLDNISLKFKWWECTIVRSDTLVAVYAVVIHLRKEDNMLKMRHKWEWKC